MRNTKAELQNRNTELEKENSTLFLALTDLIRGGVNAPKWFRKGAIKLGITRPTAANGGIAILIESHVATYYFEDLEKWASEHAANCPGEFNMNRRTLCEEARKYINSCNLGE